FLAVINVFIPEMNLISSLINIIVEIVTTVGSGNFIVALQIICRNSITVADICNNRSVDPEAYRRPRLENHILPTIRIRIRIRNLFSVKYKFGGNVISISSGNTSLLRNFEWFSDQQESFNSN